MHHPDRPTEPTASERPVDARPSGAIFVTTFLTVVILALWGGVYLLNLARS